MRRVALLVVVWMAIGPVVWSLLPVPGAAAQDANARGYLDLSSTAPGPGCWVDTTVALERDGAPLPDIGIGISFIVDGQVVYGTREITGADGVAYLGFETGWAPAGSAGWLDVQVDGTSSGGMSVNVTEDGGCTDAPGGTDIWANVDAVVPAFGPDDDSSTLGDADTGINVANYAQQRPLSCEYAALVSAIAAYGGNVSEYDFDAIVGWSDNPHWGYRGDINAPWGGTDNYGVYAEPLAAALPAFGYVGDVFYAGGDATPLTQRIDAGAPVVVWLGLLCDTGFAEYTEEGTPYQLTPGEHTVVVYDYDDNGVYAMDPATGTRRFYDWGWFMSLWNIFDGMSLGVYPG